ncbi:MAG: hypothetical protein K8S16_05550 [Bacteroidales bacterium]|nr:hypothetical protein [Bacteroidales bacterium]
METYKTRTHFNKDLQTWFNNLPLKEGQDIEVIVIPTENTSGNNLEVENLSGTVIEYNSPFKSAIK